MINVPKIISLAIIASLIIAASSFALYSANKRDNKRKACKEWFEQHNKRFDSVMAKAHFYLNKEFKYRLDSLLFNTNTDSVSYYTKLKQEAESQLQKELAAKCPY